MHTVNLVHSRFLDIQVSQQEAVLDRAMEEKQAAREEQQRTSTKLGQLQSKTSREIAQWVDLTDRLTSELEAARAEILRLEKKHEHSHSHGHGHHSSSHNHHHHHHQQQQQKFSNQNPQRHPGSNSSSRRSTPPRKPRLVPVDSD